MTQGSTFTIFATARPFLGEYRLIQRNAIRSWTLLEPRPEILIFGNDEGVAEVAAEFGVRHIPDIKLDERGVPLPAAMIEAAERLSTTRLFCFTGADCILFPDFMQAIRAAETVQRPFLMLGRWWNHRISSLLEFEPGWEARLLDELRRYSHRTTWGGSAYLVYPRGFLADFEISSLASNNALDNWVVYYARARRAMVLDGSAVATVVHQDHPRRGTGEARAALIANAKADARHRQLFNIGDSTHVVTRSGSIRRPWAPYYLWRHLYNLPVFHPWLMPLRRPVEGFMTLTRPLRIRLGWEFTGYRKSGG